MKNLALLFSALIIVSCATSVKSKLAKTNYQRLDPGRAVIVLNIEDQVPSDSEFIGDVKIGDSGFTKDCGYNEVVSDAVSAARSAGANIVHIVEIKKPTALGSTCYRVKAKMYRNFDSESLATITNKRDLKNKSRLPEDADYALIHFYRPSSGAGYLLGYKIKNINDSVVGRLRNGEKFVFKTKNFGYHKFYGVLETKEEININVEKGKEYFVRCSVNMGVVLGRPEINLIENYIGMKEFAEMN
ncbi:hypothetical protein [Flavobacterium sp.]|jgi:hypothetical protein|uniref:hypothetical protein n=1 Tax=Flavobacterium sp. TaxID=239 RepID=UPI0037BEE68F